MIYNDLNLGNFEVEDLKTCPFYNPADSLKIRVGPTRAGSAYAAWVECSCGAKGPICEQTYLPGTANFAKKDAITKAVMGWNVRTFEDYNKNTNRFGDGNV